MGDQADYLIDKEIEKHMSVNGLIDDYDLFNYSERETTNVWITASGDLLYYYQIEEQHARNILKQLQNSDRFIAPELLKRIKYFDDKKPKWKELF